MEDVFDTDLHLQAVVDFRLWLDDLNPKVLLQTAIAQRVLYAGEYFDKVPFPPVLGAFRAVEVRKLTSDGR